MVGQVAVDGVFRQGALAPGVGAAHTMDVEVDVDTDESSSRHLMRVKQSEVLVAVVPGADAERLKAFDADGASGL